MSYYKLSLAAMASLTDIYAYTHEKWGENQADKYLDGLYNCFERIADKSEIWRPTIADFEVDGFYTKYEKHFIYWKQLSDGEVGIVAILHEQMHQIDRLSDAFGH